jgi:endonuclease/exonuclease/phosphatase (EEP) superfamily protein YafD
MFVQRFLKYLWLIPGVLAVIIHFTAVSVSASDEQGACASVLGQGGPQQGGLLSGNLEVLSWNIQKASNAGWAEDLVSFSEDVDLAFIQEASLQAKIPGVIPADLHSVFAAGYSTANLETGVMTLSNGSPSSNCNLTSMEPWLRTLKATSITEYPLQGREDRLLAINLHAVNFDLSLQSLKLQLGALADILDTHPGPVILAGDLNTWSDPRQSLVDEFMRDHGLGSVIFEPDLRTTVFGHALDHIYVRGLRAESAEVIPVSTSDHNPLRVRLALF